MEPEYTLSLEAAKALAVGAAFEPFSDQRMDELGVGTWATNLYNEEAVELAVINSDGKRYVLVRAIDGTWNELIEDEGYTAHCWDLNGSIDINDII